MAGPCYLWETGVYKLVAANDTARSEPLAYGLPEVTMFGSYEGLGTGKSAEFAPIFPHHLSTILGQQHCNLKGHHAPEQQVGPLAWQVRASYDPKLFTFVNGIRVQPTATAELPLGGILQLGPNKAAAAGEDCLQYKLVYDEFDAHYAEKPIDLAIKTLPPAVLAQLATALPGGVSIKCDPEAATAAEGMQAASGPYEPPGIHGMKLLPLTSSLFQDVPMSKGCLRIDDFGVITSDVPAKRKTFLPADFGPAAGAALAEAAAPAAAAHGRWPLAVRLATAAHDMSSRQQLITRLYAAAEAGCSAGRDRDTAHRRLVVHLNRHQCALAGEEVMYRQLLADWNVAAAAPAVVPCARPVIFRSAADLAILSAHLVPAQGTEAGAPAPGMAAGAGAQGLAAGAAAGPQLMPPPAPRPPAVAATRRRGRNSGANELPDFAFLPLALSPAPTAAPLLQLLQGLSGIVSHVQSSKQLLSQLGERFGATADVSEREQFHSESKYYSMTGSLRLADRHTWQHDWPFHPAGGAALGNSSNQTSGSSNSSMGQSGSGGSRGGTRGSGAGGPSAFHTITENIRFRGEPHSTIRVTYPKDGSRVMVVGTVWLSQSFGAKAEIVRELRCRLHTVLSAGLLQLYGSCRELQQDAFWLPITLAGVQAALTAARNTDVTGLRHTYGPAQQQLPQQASRGDTLANNSTPTGLAGAWDEMQLKDD